MCCIRSEVTTACTAVWVFATNQQCQTTTITFTSTALLRLPPFLFKQVHVSMCVHVCLPSLYHISLWESVPTVAPTDLRAFMSLHGDPTGIALICMFWQHPQRCWWVTSRPYHTNMTAGPLLVSSYRSLALGKVHHHVKRIFRKPHRGQTERNGAISTHPNQQAPTFYLRISDTWHSWTSWGTKLETPRKKQILDTEKLWDDKCFRSL